MLGGMLVQPAGGPPSATAVLAIAASAAEALAAVAAGADAIDVGPASQAEIALFRTASPGTVVCADAGSPVLVPSGAASLARIRPIYANPGAAQEAGLALNEALVIARPGQLADLAADGWAALVDVDELARQAGAADPAGLVAIAAISCWLGAAAVRTRQVQPVRRAIDMTLSIRGLRPPAHAVRGLA
jgi:hypothetical protein